MDETERRQFERRRKRLYREQKRLLEEVLIVDSHTEDVSKKVRTDIDYLHIFHDDSGGVSQSSESDEDDNYNTCHIEVGDDFAVPEEEETDEKSEGDGEEAEESFEEEIEESTDVPEEEENCRVPLYAGSQITLLESVVMLLSVFFHCQLSVNTLKVIIELIKLHLPERNNFFKSLHFLKKFLPTTANGMKKHRYCRVCTKLLSKETLCCQQSDFDAFLTFSIFEQLKTLFCRKSFRDNCSHRFHRNKNTQDNIEDIFDGKLYRQYFENGYLREFSNVSFTFYTDGISLYKSSKFNVWPLFLIVNELPYSLRYLPENVIFAGLWYGRNGKPNFNTFMLPLLEELSVLSSTGIDFKLNNDNSKINVRAKIICGTCDLPARAAVLNMTYFNGHYSCHKCLIKGTSIEEDGKKKGFVFPFEEVIKRNHFDFCRRGLEALNQSKANFGCKGPTLFAKVMDDVIMGTGIDVMHAVFGGTVKNIVQFLFDKKYSSYSFSLYKKSDTMDKMLQNIRPPNFVQRLPRSFLSNLGYLKIQEFKNFFLYYSLPILTSIMPEPYLSHYASFVQAVYLLSKDSVSEEDINHAEVLLKKFVQMFEGLYGLKFMYPNLHTLLHMGDSVRELGPLWVTSCFPLEDLNGKLTRLVHGTRFAEVQIQQSFSALQLLPKLLESISESSRVSRFLQSLKKCPRLKFCEEIEHSLFVVGKCHFVNSPPLIEGAFLACSMKLPTKCWVFHRLKKGGLLYVSRSYPKNLRTISYCVIYQIKNCYEVGLIHCFIRYKHCICENVSCNCSAEFGAVIEKCARQPLLGVEICSFVEEILSVDEHVIINVKDIIGMNFFVEVNNQVFSIPPAKTFSFS